MSFWVEISCIWFTLSSTYRIGLFCWSAKLDVNLPIPVWCWVRGKRVCMWYGPWRFMWALAEKHSKDLSVLCVVLLRLEVYSQKPYRKHLPRNLAMVLNPEPMWLGSQTFPITNIFFYKKSACGPSCFRNVRFSFQSYMAFRMCSNTTVDWVNPWQWISSKDLLTCVSSSLCNCSKQMLLW